MSEYVGVGIFHSTRQVKRNLLLFDKLAHPFKGYEEVTDPSFRADMQWLRDKGIVFEPPSKAFGRLLPPPVKKVLDSASSAPAPEFGSKLVDVVCRLRAVQLSSQNVRAVSLFRPQPEISRVLSAKAGTGDVLRIVLQKMPQPAETTSLEEIIRFRGDAKTTTQLVRLRHWLNAMATKNVSGNELVEELEYLTNEYEEHMRFHRMKTSIGMLEIVVTTTAEIAEDLVKFRLRKLADLPLYLRHQRLQLMEAELKAPGREIAYVVSARNAFG